MLIAILMTVCLHADAKACKEERIEFKGSALACVVEAQPIVAEWGVDHPEWRVARWKCSSRG